MDPDGRRDRCSCWALPAARRCWPSCCWWSAGPGPACACPQELAPAEDRGRVQLFVVGPEGREPAVHAALPEHRSPISRKDEVTRGNATRVIQRTGNFNRQADVSSGMVLLPLKPWERAQGHAPRRSCSGCAPGPRTSPACASCRARPGGLGGGGKPVQIVLQGAEYAQVAAVAERVMKCGRKNPGLLNLETDLPGAPADAARGHRPQQGRRSRRVADQCRAGRWRPCSVRAWSPPS